METKVTEEIWKEGIRNLNEKRAISPTFERRQNDAPAITDYENHLKKIKIGESLLDVGCGDCSIRKYLPLTTTYTGIDAFPINDIAIKAKIEELESSDNSFDTVVCFACLDGCQDLDKAIDNMKRIAKKNIYILTGIDIKVDKYHTFSISKKYLTDKFMDMEIGHEEMLHPKVLLIEFRKP